MSEISSHRDLRGSKMRSLIIATLFACAAAAPSVPLGPVVQTLAYPAVYPTISPGDIQAAAIDAQVQAEDLARAAADKARELTEQATENINEKVTEQNDLVKEKVGEQFWSVEDKKWQALDAIKTAEAQIDGSIASNADVLAKNAVVLPYAALRPVSPFAPFPPVVYSGVPILKSAEEIKTEEKKIEENKPVEMKEQVKSAIPEDKKDDTVTVEAQTTLDAKPEEAKQLFPAVYAAPLPIAPAYRFPLVAPFQVAPVYKYGAIPQLAITPVLAKTVW